MKNILYNLFVNIKNGQIAKRSFVFQPKTKTCIAFLDILWDEGFILGYKFSKPNPNMLKIFLKYRNKTPVINSLRLLSKPTDRVYYSVSQLWKLDFRKGVVIVSTEKGLMTISECKKLKIGGEPLLMIK